MRWIFSPGLRLLRSATARGCGHTLAFPSLEKASTMA
jgi:hypothetical protein